MSGSVYFDVLRHGQTQLLLKGQVLRGRTDDPLTELGYQQMLQGFKNHYNQRAWQAIITSPLSRCCDFAKDMAQTYQLPLIGMDDIQEIDFGDWEGCDSADLYQKYPEQLAVYWNTPSQFTPPNAESVHMFSDRIMGAVRQIDDICTQNQWQNVCVISHGGVIKMLSCLSQGLPLDELLKMPADLGKLYHFCTQDFIK